MTIAQMKEKKIELGLTNEMIAEESGVPLSTVQKIFGGVTKAPRKQSLDAIQKVLLRQEGSGIGVYGQSSAASQGMMQEAAYSYNAVPKDERHTIDDYYALPEDQRVELIDGVFYDMGAPTMLHQLILGELYILFRECVDKHDMPCYVFLSPCDVRLDRDDYTMVQPDLLVICEEFDIDAIRYEGAPDLVAEILSPATRMKDMVLKLYKYQNAGVKEYWIIDPKNRTVTVHDFRKPEEYAPVSYSFDEVIPVRTSEGLCRIDFSRINRKINMR